MVQNTPGACRDLLAECRRPAYIYNLSAALPFNSLPVVLNMMTRNLLSSRFQMRKNRSQTDFPLAGIVIEHPLLIAKSLQDFVVVSVKN